VSTALEGRGPIYVLERPSADPYVATFASLPDQLPRDLGTAVKLPRSDLAHARPRVIQTADGKRYRLVEDGRARLVARTTTPYIRYNASRPPCTTSSPLVQTPDSCNEEIYLFNVGNVAIPR
jgi:hypothetical protein